jgi:hypothetical protein
LLLVLTCVYQKEHMMFLPWWSILSENRQPQPIIVRLFKTNETTSQASTRNLTKLLDQYDLRMKIIAYVKNEGANFECHDDNLQWIVKFLIWSKVSKAFALAMHFSTHAHMRKYKKKIAKA